MFKYLLFTLTLVFGCSDQLRADVTKRDNDVTQKSGQDSCHCPQQAEESEITYFNQYDNRLNPGSSCQNTSIAMLLSKFGWWGRPDDITREWGKRLCSVAKRTCKFIQ